MTDQTSDPMEARLNIVRELIYKGMTQAEIVRECQDKYGTAWNISDRQIRTYHAKVMDSLAEEALGIDRAAYFTRQLHRLDHLYNEAMLAKDLRTALSTIKQTIDLLRLDSPDFKMDWKQAAEKAGLKPSEVFERMVAAMAKDKVNDLD